MRNFIQRGDTLTLPAPYDVRSGDGALIGAIFGVAAENAANGTLVDLATRGVFTLPKVTAQAVALGAPVFWDDTARTVTTDGAGKPRIGVAVAAAGTPSATLDVRLNGSF